VFILTVKICSKCGKGKVNGYCQPCKSEQRRKRVAEKRIAQGLSPVIEGREAHCDVCLARVALNEDIRGEICSECQKIARRKRVKARRIEQGIPVKSDFCLKCGKQKINGRCLPCNNKVKNANKSAKKAKLREDQGKNPWGTRASSPCIKCGNTKENVNSSCCNECNNAMARERYNIKRIEINIRPITLTCECGKEKESTRKVYCDDCATSRRKEQAKVVARIIRASPDYKAPIRGIYCGGCQKIKENQNSGYCNACERKRYLLKSKPDCATCGAIKKNPRDAYCGPCKYKAAKERRPLRNYEQIFKENVRKFTWARINDGTLLRLPCEVCGEVEGVEAHHDDYYIPLDVRWLCKKHHYEHHINERNKEY
jgi:hypothetical protein